MSRSLLAHPLETEEHKAIYEAAAAAFSGSMTVPAGADEDWVGVAVPEALGGAGGSQTDLAAVIEAGGATLSSTGVMWTTGIACQMLAAAQTPPATVEDFAQGKISAAIPALRSRLTAGMSGLRTAAGRMDGEVLALGAADATLVMPLEVDGRFVIALVSAAQEGVSTSAISTMDPTRDWTCFRFEGLSLTDLVTVEVPAVMERWQATAGLALAIDSVGAARVVLERTISYATTREQFGRVLGSFQSYKHRCADAYISLTGAQSIVRCATMAAGETSTVMRLAAATHVLPAMTRICSQAVQMHGGVGFSQESGLHLYLRRTRANEIIAGVRQGTTRQLLTEYVR